MFEDYTHSALNPFHIISIPTAEIQKSVQEHIQISMPKLDDSKKKNKRKKNKKKKIINSGGIKMEEKMTQEEGPPLDNNKKLISELKDQKET